MVSSMPSSRAEFHISSKESNASLFKKICFLGVNRFGMTANEESSAGLNWPAK